MSLALILILVLCADAVRSCMAVTFANALQRVPLVEPSDSDIAQSEERHERNKRAAVLRLWPGGIVPYAFTDNPKWTITPECRGNILAAFERFHNKTCIRFVPRNSSHTAYIELMSDPQAGCAAIVGHTGGAQWVNLAGCCSYPGSILHELMHAIGFMHEFARPDTYLYYKLGQAPTKTSASDWGDSLIQDWATMPCGVRYDFGSVMQYRGDWSKQALHANHSSQIAQRMEDFSDWDIAEINQNYNCPGTDKGTVQTYFDDLANITNIIMKFHELYKNEPGVAHSTIVSMAKFNDYYFSKIKSAAEEECKCRLPEIALKLLDATRQMAKLQFNYTTVWTTIPDQRGL